MTASRRLGTAWVNYSDGSLYVASTTDASCTKTSYVAQKNFATFGMGFSSNGAGAPSETLFLAGFTLNPLGPPTAQGLGSLDVTFKKLTFVGEFSGALKGQPAELTGTGDGRLFGFYHGTPAKLAEIQKADAIVVGWPRGSLPGAPTDPDVRNSRIRLFETQLRYVRDAMAGVSSG